MQINVTVRNGGEDSYETKLYFDVPEGFEYSGIQTTDDKTAPICSPTTDEPSEDGSWKFSCDLGNPLPANKVVNTVVRLTADEKKPPLKDIDIKAFVNSSNAEAEGTGADNAVTFKVPVDFRNQLRINGRSSPPEISFSIHNKTRTDIFDDRELGPVVSHLIQVGITETGKHRQFRSPISAPRKWTRLLWISSGLPSRRRAAISCTSSPSPWSATPKRADAGSSSSKMSIP